ncbi:MAG: FAD-dependent oxidoreductase [Lachnospiraceae bacterium]
MNEHLLLRGRIGNVELKNRIFKPAAQDFPTYNGCVNQELIDFCAEQARGGAGLIITGLFNVNPHENELRNGHPTTVKDANIAGMGTLATAIHENGAKACLQLAHYGSHGEPVDPEYGWRCVSYDGVENEHWFPLLFPQYAGKPYPHKEYTVEEIHELVSNYGDGARRAMIAGFDMVEVHGANMHGLNTWLTPRMNKRTDEYGGNLENRCRILFEIVEDIQKKCGSRFPILVRLNAEDIVPGGHTIEDTVWIAKQLEARGVAAVDLACMKNAAPMQQPMGETLPYAEAVKKEISVPLMLVGSMNTPEMGDAAISEGKVDFVGMARQLYADPYWPQKVLEQRPEDIRPCLRCNECLNMNRNAFAGNLVCTMNPQLGKERTLPIIPAEKSKKVAVIGAGPAGMEAALIASQRGHQVTLFEKRKLGGLVNEASTPVFKADLKRMLKYFEVQIEKQNISVRYEEATADKMQGFDAAIVASGSKKATLRVPGADGKHVQNAIDWLSEQKTIGDKIVIIGGGSVGIEVALTNAMAGKEVTVVEMMDDIMKGEYIDTKMIYLNMLKQYHVTVLTGTGVKSIQDHSVTVEKDGIISEIPATDVLTSVGLCPDLTLRDELDKIPGLLVYYAGDCERPKLIFDAIHAGFMVGRLV